MKIDIPNNVQFRTDADKSRWDAREYRPVCFRHAVVRAVRGETIKTELCESWGTDCDDCAEAKS